MNNKDIIKQDQRNSVIKVTDTVIKDGIKYRVIDMDEDTVTIIRMDTTSFRPTNYPFPAIIDGLNEGKISIEPFAISEYTADDTNKIFKRRKAVINDVLLISNNRIVDFLLNHSEESVRAIMKKHGIKSKGTLYLIIGDFIRGGFDYNSLMTKPRKERKPVTDRVKNPGVKKANGVESYVLKAEDYKYIDEAIEVYKKHKQKEKYTLDDAYAYLMRNHYTEKWINPSNNAVEEHHWKEYGKRPSFDQFYHIFLIKNNAASRLGIKVSKERIRNDFRLLPSTSLMYAHHPGELVEIDACEINLSLVGVDDRGISLGRPTMYMMVDVYTRLILAVSVGFGKNSQDALIKLFVNLAEDKVELCERYGIILNSPNLWPSCILPEKIRTDRGADFTSKGFSEVCSNIDMILQLVPGATGSYKGIIEQMFHQYGTSIDRHVAGIGLITKEYGSRHHEQAVLNILECYRIALIFALYHNNLTLSEYPLTQDMELINLDPSPVELWKFGVEHSGAPLPILNRTTYLDSLRLRETVTLKHSGFVFKGVKYYPDDCFELQDIMTGLHRKGHPIDIFYDPSDISKVIYYGEKHKRYEIKQNLRLPDQEGFDHYDFTMWKAYKKKQSGRLSDLKEKKREKIAEMDEHIRGITSTAVADSPTYASKKNMSTNRKKEAEKDRRRGSITEAQERLKNEDNTYEPPTFTANIDPCDIPVMDNTDLTIYNPETAPDNPGVVTTGPVNNENKEEYIYTYSKEKHLEQIMNII